MCAYFGRKPSGNDAGIGDVGAGAMRASIMGSLTGHFWIINFGGRVGRRSASGTPTIEYAIYEASSGGVVGARLGVSGTTTAPTIMEDNASGADVVKKPAAPIIGVANQPYALAIRANGGGAAAVHGQDNSGWVMHQRYGIGSSYPTPFAATQVDNQGKESLWVEYILNRRPKTPSNPLPVAGSTIAQTLPPMAVDFRDDDEVLTGFSLGQCDKLKSYSFEIWNSSKTTRIKSSGKQNADGTMQTNRRATWTPTGAALTPGTYVARAIVYDLTDSPSDTAEWTFVVNAGGAFSSVDLAAGSYVSGSSVTLATSPGFTATWSHLDSYSTATVTARIVDASGGIVRTAATISRTIANGASSSFTFADFSWSALPKGQVARIQIQATDTASGTSGWASSPLFTVNADPTVTALVSPGSGAASTTRPKLVVDFADGNDADASLTTTVAVRASGDTGSGTTVATKSFNSTTGYWEFFPNATNMPAVGNFEWRAMATDPWGVSSAWSSWRAISFVNPPAVTLTAPTGTITTGTPTITFTVDRAMTSFQAVISTGGVQIFDSGLVTSSVGNQPVPPGRLRNATTYSLSLTVNTTDGLSVTNTYSFLVSYTQPAAVSNLSVTKVAGSFEGTDPTNWSLARIAWDAVSTGVVADADFGGYVVRRRNNATGEDRVLRQLYTRGETVFIDKTAQSGTSYTYSVVYLKLMNNIDFVESVPASGTLTIVLNHAVLVSMGSDNTAVPLFYWDERGRKPHTAKQIVETWGEKPIVFQGIQNYDSVSGTFLIFDDDLGAFTSRDVIAALDSLNEVDLDTDGDPVPQIVCYRDPKRRVFYGTLTDYDEKDRHEDNISEVEIEVTENATDAWGAAL